MCPKKVVDFCGEREKRVGRVWILREE
jgi:hypothetical protein